MNKKQLTEEIAKLIRALHGGTIGFIAVIVEEDSPSARIVHNLSSDFGAGEILKALAPKLSTGDA